MVLKLKIATGHITKMITKSIALVIVLVCFQGCYSLDCPQDGNFAFPGTCSSNYYMCVGGVPYNQTCPGGNIFDPVTLICMSPDAVSCRATTPLPFQCPSPDGNFEDPMQPCSSSYYACIGSVAYLQTCPGNSIFDAIKGICVSPSTATCLMTTIATTLGPFVCPEPDGFFPDPAHPCTGYYFTCIGGIAYNQTCPGNAIFDPSTKTCVSPSSASCLGNFSTTANPPPSNSTSNSPATTSTPATTPIPSTTPAAFVCPEDGNFPIEGDCKNYYSCSNGIYIIQTCPSGLVFNPDSKLCDWPFNVPSCENEGE